MAFYQDLPWHPGEEELHRALRVPDHDNPTVPTLSPQLANHLQTAPLLAVGTLDAEGRPWTTLWGSEDRGLARPLTQQVVGIKTTVAGKHDPVVEALVGKEANGEVVKEEGKGRMVSGLTIDLETRKRVKLFGRLVAGALTMRDDELTGANDVLAEMQLAVKVEQSLGNCPKYLNSKTIVSAPSTQQQPELMSDSPRLSQEALDLLAKADLCFISSSNEKQDMDTNHRGGPPGFIRVLSNPTTTTASSTDARGAELVYPEYSGNRLYQTLGNLAVTPKAGICIPDFETGGMLYLTGSTETLIGQRAAEVLPRSNLAVKIRVEEARFVAHALSFRGVAGQPSPYNPRVRYLATENPGPNATTSSSSAAQQASLLSQTALTPSVSRFRFRLSSPPPSSSKSQPMPFKAGQYATLSFAAHLNIGYSHMRDDDPGSINDDFVRTFTVSSPPAPAPAAEGQDAQEESGGEVEFEITARRVGRVTEFLFKHFGSEGGRQGRRGGLQDLDVEVLGFGGEFEVRQSPSTHDGDKEEKEGEEQIAFVAAGVGITPLLPSLPDLDLDRLTVLWAVREADLGLVRDTLKRSPRLARRVRVFVTGSGSGSDDGDEVERPLVEFEEQGVDVARRRMERRDVDELRKEGRALKRFYLCTPVPMRKVLEEWLEGEELVFEDFNF